VNVEFTNVEDIEVTLRDGGRGGGDTDLGCAVLINVGCFVWVALNVMFSHAAAKSARIRRILTETGTGQTAQESVARRYIACAYKY